MRPHRMSPMHRVKVRPPASPSRRRAAAALLLSAVLGGAGCESPDHWSVFEVEWQQRLEREAERSVEVPEAFKPRVAEPVTIDAAAEGPIELSIEEATVLALRNNRDLAVQQLQPVIVGAFEQVERSIYDPEIFAEATIAESEASETSRATGDQFNVQTQDRGFVAGVRQRLPTGTTVELTGSEDRSFSNRTDDQHEARLGLTVTQALLRGFGPAVNLVSVRQAELDTLASIYQLRGFTEALVAEVESTYWNYAFAREAIRIFEQSLELAKRQQNETEQRIEVGVLSATEAAAARAEVALREQDLIDARSAMETQRLRLMRLINVDPDSLLQRPIVPVSEPGVNAAPIDDANERILVARRYRPDLNEARLQLRQDRLQTIVTRNGLLPRLDFFVTLGKTGFGGSFYDAARNLSGDETYDVSAGVSFSHLLGNRAAEARDLAARATRQQSAAAVANLEQLVALDVRIAATEVERARQQIDATAATRRLREEALRAEEERFRVGASTSLLVAQAQRDLVASQIDEVEAVINYRLALIQLHLAEGTLLERRGIHIPMPEQE